MKALHLRSLFVLASVPILTLAGCGDGDSTTTGTGAGGSGGTTISSGGGGSGGTTSSGGSGGGTAGSGATGGTTSSGGSGGGTGGAPVVTADCSPPQGTVPALKLTTIATAADGLEKPILVRAAPGDDERLFIVEQSGTIRIVKNGVLEPVPFLDISDRVHQPGGNDERGLLGLAFHPDYAQNGRFFVFYTDNNNAGGSKGDQNIVEFARETADAAKADAAGLGIETQKLMTIFDSEGNHNGGMLDFSPSDGFLYIGLGDGGGAGDAHGPLGNGQNLATRWGKILRVDVAVDVSMAPYTIPAGNMTDIPAGNPTVGELVPEIWDFGLRNPWRFTFDPCTSDLYIADVGQGAWEEVNIEAKGDGKKNYGWKYYEGDHIYSQDTPGFEAAVVTAPVDEYPHDGGNCSINGGFVYRSSAIPALRGTYFYGDYCTGRTWSFRWDGSTVTDKVERTADLDTAGPLVSFGTDNLGNVYMVYLDGGVYRIDAE